MRSKPWVESLYSRGEDRDLTQSKKKKSVKEFCGHVLNCLSSRQGNYSLELKVKNSPTP